MSSGGASRPIPRAVPVAMPIKYEEEAARRKGEALRRKLAAAAGRAGTILVPPGTLGEPRSGKATSLGV